MAEQKRLEKEEKKKKKQKSAEEGLEAEPGTSKPKKRRLRKKVASPPPAVTDDERAHAADVEAAAAASINDSMQDPDADADDESQASPEPPKKKQKLRLKKPAVKSPAGKAPAPRSVRIQEPAADPAPRRTIDTTKLVVDAPLASKPPPESRSKSRHDPKNFPEAQPKAAAPPAKLSQAAKPRSTVAKPGQSYAQVGTKKVQDVEFHRLEILAAEQRLRDAQAKAKADKEAREQIEAG